ncbi:MAG: LPXTG-motif cell wall-anchored protein [Patiriisocius sp.]|jgi:LPXTG-motif cell wall-anchored protein
MNIKILIATLLFMCVTTVDAQNQEQTDNTIEGQFVKVIDKSNNYQEFKVIKKTKLVVLRRNILDSISKLEKSIETKDVTIASQGSTINTLESNLSTTQNDLTISQGKEDGIELFGMITQKGTYNMILFSIIGLLLLGLFFFIFRFKNSNSVTIATNHKFSEIEREFEAYRQKKLEDEQILRRKLQDEINKNK